MKIARAVWNESWHTGDERLDRDHLAMFTMLESIRCWIEQDQPVPNDLMESFEACMVDHFRHEHELMKVTLCSTMPSHDRYHEQLLGAWASLCSACEGHRDRGYPFSTFREQFIYHQDEGGDRELVRHLCTAKRGS